MEFMYLIPTHVLGFFVFIGTISCGSIDNGGDPGIIIPSREKRYLGGSPSERSPIMASIQYYARHMCGGTIYSERLILTAAHCVEQVWYKRITVRLGSIRSDYGGELYNVTHMVAHKYFYRQSSKNDVALIQVDRPIEFNGDIEKVKLYDWFEDAEDGITGIGVGWGAVDSINRTSSQLLNKAYLQVEAKEDCRRKRGVGIICTYSSSADFCTGDSGGPLLIFGSQAGIVSAGECAINRTSQFTAIADHRQWINRKSADLKNQNHLPYAYLEMDEIRRAEFKQFAGKRRVSYMSPRTVPVILRGVLICTATVIDDYHVLTTASCVQEGEPYFIITFSDNGQQSRDVIEVIKHEDYSQSSKDRFLNNIALLRVAKIINLYRTVKELKIYKEDDQILMASQAKLFWWESLEVAGGNKKALELYSLNLTMNGNEECDGIYLQSGEGSLSENQLCASGYSNMCRNMAGGSLFIKRSLVGIYSWKHSCWNYQFPSVYTKIASYRSWMNEKLEMNRNTLRLRLEDPCLIEDYTRN